MLNKWLTISGRIAIKLISLAGMVFIVLAILAFTRLPFDMHRNLGECDSGYFFTPEVILMLGGGGMPSESNLIRLYYTAQMAERYPHSRIIVAHPTDTSVAGQMRDYLLQAGVDQERISFMMKGTNTREQALYTSELFPELQNSKIVLVTSPENMYRSIKVFRKLKFQEIGGEPAFENAMFVDLKYNHQKAGGRVYVPDVSGSNGLRYNFWNYLKLEITCIREYVAITYYKLNGWI